ncbi:unnamed protein product [Caenorhabditis angaria]|uniref:Uncharacterized protein n=1 Tax=Caenorhabditis angaria TaxID=860376 RepID=A0A9P1IRB5_9PELO|nr:unnamed protein product [Caenorhabditis angaria]
MEDLLGNSTSSNITTLLAETTTALVLNSTTSSSTTTSTTTIPPTTSSTTPKITTTTTQILTTTTEYIKSTPIPVPDVHSTTSIAFISLVVFLVGVALIAKIVISHKKKRLDLIGGTARWRISASSASSNSINPGSNQTTATYLPMGRSNRALSQQQQPLTNGLDNPGPDRLDWERQFFDDSEATTPSRLLLR